MKKQEETLTKKDWIDLEKVEKDNFKREKMKQKGTLKVPVGQFFRKY